MANPMIGPADNQGLARLDDARRGKIPAERPMHPEKQKHTADTDANAEPA